MKSDFIVQRTSEERQEFLSNLCKHLERNFPVTPEMRDEIEESPTHALDRLMSFRSEPWYTELRAAFARLEQGTFGLCAFCQQQIEQHMLAQNPITRFCVVCEQKLKSEKLTDERRERQC